jgi:hypothetical protein
MAAAVAVLQATLGDPAAGPATITVTVRARVSKRIAALAV